MLYLCYMYALSLYIIVLFNTLLCNMQLLLIVNQQTIAELLTFMKLIYPDQKAPPTKLSSEDNDSFAFDQNTISKVPHTAIIAWLIVYLCKLHFILLLLESRQKSFTKYFIEYKIYTINLYFQKTHLILILTLLSIISLYIYN